MMLNSPNSLIRLQMVLDSLITLVNNDANNNQYNYGFMEYNV